MTPEQPWVVRLFGRSVLKQRKWLEIHRALGPTDGLRCLDLGSDNGVISLLLRQQGGKWVSGDLTAEAVASITSLVGSDVHLLAPSQLPFADASFDRVVVVDMLEHVPDDAVFAAELARIVRPGGRLLINTPHLKTTMLRRLRHALGQTDEKHGHLRPGYTPAVLEQLLAGRFRLDAAHTYSHFFSELVDTAINVALDRIGKKGSSKGMVVTEGDLSRHRKLFLAYSAIYPFVRALSALDVLVPASGYMLLASLTRR